MARSPFDVAGPLPVPCATGLPGSPCYHSGHRFRAELVKLLQPDMDAVYTSTLANYDLRPPVELFPLGSQGMNNTTVGVRTGDGDFVLKTYQTHADPTTIHYEHRLLEWLAGQRTMVVGTRPRRKRIGAAESRSYRAYAASLTLARRLCR